MALKRQRSMRQKRSVGFADADMFTDSVRTVRVHHNVPCFNLLALPS
jgi:hypothetical protein